MRAAEASQFAKKFDDDDGALLKPQWLQHTSGAGISNQFRSAVQFRGRGGRKFGGDDRRPRGASPKVSNPASSDFPPLAPFYRSHSTGSLTPADIPSASSRLLSASKEEKSFSINRECDFPTLATAAAVVEQPARMHKSKSATALPQAISPSSDLLKAHHTTLAALAGPAVSSAPPPSAAAASSPALTPATPVTAAPLETPPLLAKQTHKKKPSFSDKVSFSEIAATEKATSNKDKFQQTMANSRAELQRFKSLVPSKPVHPALANRPSIRPFQPKVPRPKMPMPTASVTVLKAPDNNPMTMMPTSPTMRKATSAPVLPMSTTLLPRSPPNPSPLSTICASSTASSSSSSSSRDAAHHPAAVASSSPPRPALLSSSQSARTLPQASTGAWAETSFAAPRQHFAIPLASSRFSFANGAASASSSGGSTVSPRRRDSSPATSTVNSSSSSSSSSPCSSSAVSPLTSPRRSSVTSVMALVQQESDTMIGTMGIYSSSAPLSPRMTTIGSNGGSNALSSSSGGKTGKKPLRNSGSAASSSSSSSSSKTTANGGTRQRRRSVKASSGSGGSGSSSSTTNGGSRRQSADDGESSNCAAAAATAAANGYATTANGFGGVAHHLANGCDSTASSSGSSGDSSDDEHGLLAEAEYDRVNDDELMMIATGITSITATSIAGVHLEPRLPPDDDDSDHHPPSQSSLLAGINGDASGGLGSLGSLKDEFCPFSWEMRADGQEWSEFSEEAVSGFMKTLGYDAQDDGARGLDGDDDDGEGLTEEEIRLAKQQIERANINTLQQLLEKKKQGLSESLKNWQPPHIPGSGSGSPAAFTAAASSAGSALASSSTPSSSSSSPSSSSTSPTLLRHHPRPAASASASASGGGRRGHHQPLRSSSGPTPSSSSSSSHGRRNHHNRKPHHQLQQVLDLVASDSDESDCEEEVHGFHGIVFG